MKPQNSPGNSPPIFSHTGILYTLLFTQRVFAEDQWDCYWTVNGFSDDYKQHGDAFRNQADKTTA